VASKRDSNDAGSASGELLFPPQGGLTALRPLLSIP